jgi:hypothetical protein
MMTTRTLSRAAALVALAILIGCGDSTGPATVEKQTSDLHFLRLSTTAPLLEATVVSFYAKKGTDREVRVRFQNGEDYLRFRVPANALAQRPDGSLFAFGDSVLITITINDPTTLSANFEPSGLKFSPSTPARLQFEFGEADKDLNGDGVVNATDALLLPQVSTWRQESSGGTWLKVASAIEVEINEVQADILGFTGYALAY